MLPDALPQLVDTLLRLRHLEAAQLGELIQHLSDPQASAEEMMRRGWITQNQFSSLFPGPERRPTPRETMLVGFAHDDSPPDADGEDWSLPLDDDEDKADVPPHVEWARPDRTDDEMLPDAHCEDWRLPLSNEEDEDWSLPLSDDEDAADVPAEVERAGPDRTDLEPRPEPGTVEAVPVLSGAASTPPFESHVPVPLMAGGNEARRRESDTDKLPRQGMGWASKGLLMCTLLLGSAGLQFFWANSVPPVARQESRHAKAGDPARAADLPPVPAVPPALELPSLYAQVVQALATRDVNCSPSRQTVLGYPIVPRARASDAKPKSTASLYARVRQVVLENKTEETQRLGMGDFAYQDVPDDGSIMVGMEVSYAPFFTHQVIKSVQPIYQRSDGTRYDGAVCGSPMGVGERVVAKEGYAIGGAAIRSGMGIDGMQLTFMEIGADGLNPHKSYLSKWLGGYGGADAKTFVNDGRPIVGIAGMRSKLNFGPAFCMCLVTTKAGALADADDPWLEINPINNAPRRDDLVNPIAENTQPAAPVTEPVGEPLRTRPVPQLHTKPRQ